MEIKNNPELRGQTAGEKESFGPNDRYTVYAVHTRYHFLDWFVSDAQLADKETGLPSIIRQALTKEAAMRGL